MRRTRPTLPSAAALAALVLLAACGDDPPTAPSGVADLPTLQSGGTGDFQRYVAIGTSISAGVQGDGLIANTQRTSWPAQLARLAGRELSHPYLDGTGCRPPFASPLITFRRISGESVLAPAADLSCAPLIDGVVPPAGNVAINGARAANALFSTPENIDDPGNQKVYPRVLAPGQSQVTAMMAQKPKVVSVELFGNEVLLSRSGVAIVGANLASPAQFAGPYSMILDSVEKVGAKAVLVGVSGDIASFPAFRRGGDLWDARASFAPFNVQVAANCENSEGLLFLPFKVPSAVGEGLQRQQSGAPPATLSCAAGDPATPDFVLDASERAIVNGLLAAYGAHIQAEAERRGFAHFDVGVLYDRPENRPAFDAVTFMQSPTPYGPNVSLDGVHPSAEGARILADAAAAALNERYGLGIRRVPAAAANAAPRVTDVRAYSRVVIGPLTGLDGDLLQFRLRDRRDPGPWRLRIDWGDGVVHTPTVARLGVLSFTRTEPFAAPGRYTVSVTATDLAGATSVVATAALTVP